MIDALVLGGTGFIGSHLVDRLARSCRSVLVLGRSGAWPWGDAPPGLTVRACDLQDPRSEDTVAEAAAGRDVVFHLAGALFRPATPASRYRALHVDGLALTIEALREAGRRTTTPVRLVHVSTTGVLGPTGPDPVTEDEPARPTTEYEATKWEGERLALGARGEGLEVVVARPGLVYGPRDLHLLSLWRAVDTGRFRTIAGGKALWQPVHVSDVAAGLESLGTTPGLDGAVFHLAGAEVVTVLELARRIAETLGRSLRGPGLPFALAYAAGAALEALYAPFGGDPPLSRSRVRTMTQNRVYSIARARERLGWTPKIDLGSGIAVTTKWYRTEGLL